MKKHNFNAGPSILPREVIEKTAQAILDYNGSGLSLMEISHRAKDFQPVVDEAVPSVPDLRRWQMLRGLLLQILDVLFQSRCFLSVNEVQEHVRKLH